MTWEKAKLQYAKIHSTIGGTIRLRSYVQLEGEGLTEATGDCPNPLFASAVVKDPLVSKSLSSTPKASVKRVYEYDLQTEADKDYWIGQLGTGIEEINLSSSLSKEGEAVYDLAGRRNTNKNLQRGINIIHHTLDDGSVVIQKVFVK
jgi:alpha-L-fucosidase 2